MAVTVSGRASRSVAVEAITPSEVTCTAERLRATRDVFRSRAADSVVRALGAAGCRFLDPADEVNREALERLPDSSGLSSAMCRAVLEGMAKGWTEESLRALVRVELGGLAPLDGLGRDGSMAVGPSLCVQIGAGGVPGVGVNALLRSLLVKAPTLLKAGHRDVLLPTLYARSLGEIDASLAASLAVVYWPGDSVAHLDAALALADTAVVYGSDETVRAVRARVPVATRLVAYHHRVSVGIVGREALSLTTVAGSAAEVAAAVAMYDQRGCVSPQVVYVEEGGACSARDFAERLARAMEAAEDRWPGVALDVAEASRLQQARGTAEMMAAEHGGSVHHGKASPWTVTWEPRAFPSMPVAGRFVRVRPIRDASELPSALGNLATHLQTVGFAGLGDRVEALATELGRVGASRVAPFSTLPFPRPWWHHDGRGPLLDLVRWVDLEGAP
jgi:hypothetical protein